MAKQLEEYSGPKYNIEMTQSDEEKQMVIRIQDRYRASYLHKDALGMTKEWSTAEDYWAGDINLPEDEDDPASNTNIIQPIIESQVADLVDGATEIVVRGFGPSDEAFASDVRNVLKWVWHRNKMVPKLDEGERDRLNLGTVGWKVYYDFEALNGRGLTTIEPCSPDTLFPDPKIKDPRRIQEGDFFIQVMPYPLGELIRQFGDRAKLVMPEGNFTNYDPRIFGEADYDAVDDVVNSQALLFEYWERDDEGNLRRVYMAGGIILEDSDWTHKDQKHGTRKSFYRNGKYPFVIIPCYRKKGRLWGLSDNKLLRPVQDMINDLDDQVRMNARLMGNLQIIVGMASGINIKKWTNKPGLKIPAKDPTAWQAVNPMSMPAYILQRRDTGFRESEIVSGRSDVLEGRRAGSLRAASAIVALQEAGSRRANHKKLMLQEGFVEILDLVLDYMKEFMDEEMVFDITENGNTEYTWFRGTSLNKIPWKTRNENFDPTVSVPGTEQFKDLMGPATDDDGNDIYDEVFDDNGNITQVQRMEPMTKEAEFDLEISFGAGMPNNKSFIYQSTLELMREGILTQQEARETLKKIMNWPLIDPYNPVGEFAGRNMQNGAQIPGGMPRGMPQGGIPGQAPAQPMDPEAQMQELMMLIEQMPPEMVQQIFGQLGGMPL